MLYLTIVVPSLRQLLDMFQLLYRSSELKQRSLTQGKDGRFQ